MKKKYLESRLEDLLFSVFISNEWFYVNTGKMFRNAFKERTESFYEDIRFRT